MYSHQIGPVVSLLGGVAFLTAEALVPGTPAQLQAVGTFVGVMLVAFTAGSFGARAIAQRLRRHGGRGLRRVLIVGTEAQAQPYLASLNGSLELVDIVGYVRSEANGLCLNGGMPGDGNKSLSAILEDLTVDEVLVTSFDPAIDRGTFGEECAIRGIALREIVRIPRCGVGKYTATTLPSGEYLLSLETVPRQPILIAIKRAMDITGSIVGLLIAGIAYLIYARRIARETIGSVFFQQTRVGRNGRRFTLYKFRTMCTDAEAQLAELVSQNEMKGHIFKMREDPRVTPLGRMLRRRHLDELPQFWNVLRGDMSLVGTRPPTCAEVAHYETHHRRRLSMKPGVTGLWQLQGNERVSDFEEIVRLDCQYIDNWSLLADFTILLKTVLLLVRGNGW
ncbi:MAG: exopolysaccharide biosynthesis polyprenyl glycosylphosphotransferase [Candidatus Binataceae bacterium]